MHMNRENTIVFLALIMSAMDECHEGPSGAMYAALGGHMSLHEYQHILAMAERLGWIENNAHWLTLTAEGSVKATQFTMALNKITA